MIERLSTTMRNFIAQACVDFPNVPILGVEHIASYVMIYVRDTGQESRERFLNAIATYCFSIICDMPEACFVYGALTYGRGWKFEPNSLMGPVIGEAHRLVKSCVEYPRIVVAESVVEMVRRSELPLCLIEDTDRRYALHYLHSRVVKTMERVLRIDAGEQLKANAKILLRTHLKMVSTKSQSVDLRLANECRLLSGYWRRSAESLGMDLDI